MPLDIAGSNFSTALSSISCLPCADSSWLDRSPSSFDMPDFGAAGTSPMLRLAADFDGMHASAPAWSDGSQLDARAQPMGASHGHGISLVSEGDDTQVLRCGKQQEELVNYRRQQATLKPAVRWASDLAKENSRKHSPLHRSPSRGLVSKPCLRLVVEHIYSQADEALGNECAAVPTRPTFHNRTVNIDGVSPRPEGNGNGKKRSRMNTYR